MDDLDYLKRATEAVNEAAKELKADNDRERTMTDPKSETPETEQTCATCRYWNKLGNNTESFGTCHWFDCNSPVVPVWAVRYQSHGALSPQQSGCPTWKSK